MVVSVWTGPSETGLQHDYTFMPQVSHRTCSVAVVFLFHLYFEIRSFMVIFFVSPARSCPLTCCPQSFYF